jgi:MFS family permease
MTTQKQPLLTPIMRWFLLAIVLANISSSMIMLLTPIYLTELGASVSQVGLVFTITSVFVLALQVVGGWISDSIGRLRAIAIGSIGGVIGFTAMLLAPSWPWMLLALAINQIPIGLVGPSFGAFIAENSTEANRGRVYGLTETIYQVVGIVGPPLGGLLAGQFGFKAMLLCATLFYTIAAGLRIWMARTMRSSGEREQRPLTASSFISSLRVVATLLVGGGVITWIFATDGVRDIAARMSVELEPLYMQQVIGLSLVQIGMLGSFFSLAMMLTPMLSGRLVDRHGERVPIALGFLIMFAAYMVFLQARAYPLLVATWMLFGFGAGLLSPAFQSLISKVVPRHLLGTFNGVFYGSTGFFALPAPWIGAQLWERFNPRVPFFVTAFTLLLTTVLVWFTFKIKRGDASSAGQPAAPVEATPAGDGA